MRLLIGCAAFIAAFTVTAGAVARHSDDGTPVAAFNAIVAAFLAEDWERVADLVDPESLVVFHHQVVSGYAVDLSMTEDDVQHLMTEFPPEVAAYFREQHDRVADPATRLALELPAVGSLEELRALTPRQLFVRWLESNTMQAHLQRARKLAPLADPAVLEETWEGYQALAGRREYTVLGVVCDEPDLAHVVYRVEYRSPDGEPSRRVLVFPGDQRAGLTAEESARLERVRQYYDAVGARMRPSTTAVRRQPDGTWRLLADLEFLGAAGMMAVGYGGALGTGH